MQTNEEKLTQLKKESEELYDRAKNLESGGATTAQIAEETLVELEGVEWDIAARVPTESKDGQAARILIVLARARAGKKERAKGILDTLVKNNEISAGLASVLSDLFQL